MSIRSIVLSLLVLSMIVTPVEAQAPSNPNGAITLKLQNVPLVDAIRQALGQGFVIESGVTGTVNYINATFPDRESVLRTILKSAPGVTYRKDSSGDYIISPATVPSGNGLVPTSPQTYLGRSESGCYYVPSPYRVEKILLTFADPSLALEEVPKLDGIMQALVCPDGSIIIKGTDDGIAEFKECVHMVDVPKIPVQVRVSAEFTVTLKGGSPTSYRSSTSAVGFAGDRLPVNLVTNHGKTVNTQISLDLSSSVSSDQLRGYAKAKIITLTGKGRIHARLPIELDKTFSVAAVVPSGGQVLLASGNAQLPTGSIKFTLTASVASNDFNPYAPVRAGARASKSKLVPPDHQPITDYTVLIGATQDRPFVDNWNAPERSIFWHGFDPMRWSRFGSKLKLPVKPGKKYVLTFEAHVPNAGLRPGSGVFLGNQEICSIEKTGNIKVKGTIPPQKASPIILTVQCANWRPTDFMGAGWSDRRELGVAVRTVSLKAIP